MEIGAGRHKVDSLVKMMGNTSNSVSTPPSPPPHLIFSFSTAVTLEIRSRLLKPSSYWTPPFFQTISFGNLTLVIVNLQQGHPLTI